MNPEVSNWNNHYKPILQYYLGYYLLCARKCCSLSIFSKSDSQIRYYWEPTLYVALLKVSITPALFSAHHSKQYGL